MRVLKTHVAVIILLIGLVAPVTNAGFDGHDLRTHEDGRVMIEDHGAESNDYHSRAHEDHASAARRDPGAAWSAADSQLKEQFSNAYSAAKNKRFVFVKHMDNLGARAMLDFLELKNNPFCHGEAHELGKAVYADNKNLNESLMLCGNGCTNACMHGVVAEAFGERKYEDVVKDVDGICSQGHMASLHKPGNCAHSIGHALMLITGHDVFRSIVGCERFTTSGMDYYCATGVFMEYRDALEQKGESVEVASRASPYYPCDTFTKYPAACYRYMLREIAEGYNLNELQLIDMCLGLEDRQQLGCFHGLGAMYARDVADNPSLLPSLCLRGGQQDQIMCIEGVIEKLADFDEERAVNVCNRLDGENKQICMAGAHGKMYRLNKPTMHLYR